MTDISDPKELVRAVNQSSDPVKMACLVIGVMGAVISHHAGREFAAEFLRSAAEKSGDD